jgi:hypothetical protein
MLIIVLAFLSCINAANTFGKIINSVAETLQQSVRVSPNHPNALYGASIPEVRGVNPSTVQAISHKNLPFLTFREAIHGNSMKESKIIKYFASKHYNDPKLKQETYQDIINYITRDLEKNEISDFHRIFNLELFFNNAKNAKKVSLSSNDMNHIFEYGKLDLLKYLVGKENFHQFKDFRFLPYTLAAKNGHNELVKWILQKHPSSDAYMRMIGTSNIHNQKETFKVVADLVAKQNTQKRVSLFSQALEAALFNKRRDYVDYILKKVSDTLKDSKSSSQWSEKFLKAYSQKRPTVSGLDYFFSHKAWNPSKISIILSAMAKANDDVVERIGMELLNPRLRFDDSIGYDPLQKAIETVNFENPATTRRVKEILQNIKRKRSVDSTDNGSAAKRPRVENPIHLDRFG